MDLFLHIGSPKTGTTAIQVFLAENPNLLAKENLYVTKICFSNNHIEFAMLAVDFERAQQPGAIRRELRLRGISSADGLKRWKEKFTKKLERDIEKAAIGGASKYLVSSEFLFYLNSEHIQNLHNQLEALFSRMTVVMFVRDQVGQVESWYSQKLKNGEAVPLKEYLERQADPEGQLNWLRLDRNWSKSFGSENIVIKAHDSREDVRVALLIACDVRPLSLPMARAEESNRGVSKLEAALLILAREKFKEPRSLLRELGVSHRNLLMFAIVGRFPGDALRLSRDDVRKLRASFQSSNAELLKSRGVALELKDPESEQSKDDLTLNEQQLSAILDLLAAEALTAPRILQAKFGSLMYLMMVRLGFRSLAKMLKRIARFQMRKRGTPLPMY